MSAQLKASIKYPGSLIRPRFEPGALLLDEDLTAIVDHTRGLSRLLFRSLFGCGVICGFRVGAQVDDCANLIVTVEPGIALDCHGDPIEMRAPHQVGMPCLDKLKERLWVKIRRSGHDLNCATRDVACPSDDDGAASKPTRAKDCFELVLTEEEPKHACGCSTTLAAADKPGATPSSTIPPATTAPVTPVAPPPGTAPTQAQARTEAELLFDVNCHIPHYCGVCSCGCCDSCGDGWVVLAVVSPKVLSEPGTPSKGRAVDYTVRRFIRPVIAPDPLRTKDRDLKCTALLTPHPGS